MIAAGAALLALVLATLVPWRGRDVARAALALAVVFSPLVALGVFLAHRPGTRFGTWLLFVPATIGWFALVDLRCGRSARLARDLRRARERPRPDR